MRTLIITLLLSLGLTGCVHGVDPERGEYIQIDLCWVYQCGPMMQTMKALEALDDMLGVMAQEKLRKEKAEKERLELEAQEKETH